MEKNGDNAYLTSTVEYKRFTWDVHLDQAKLVNAVTGRAIWEGSLLPFFEIVSDSREYLHISTQAIGIDSLSETEYRLELGLGDAGSGWLKCHLEPWGVRFSQLSIRWHQPVKIVAMYFGMQTLNERQMNRSSIPDKPYWPNWSSSGYCVPCAGSGPTKSFWRSWEMGDAVLPLGSFGDAMGTPYSAAYPRPMYAAAMGGKQGWVAIGSGDIPDAALTLKLQAVTACLQYLYREDLWHPANVWQRSWREPLRMAWGDSAYEAYDKLYRSFPVSGAKSPHHQRSFVCTWGDFKENRLDLRQITDRVVKSTPSEIMILDDMWETNASSGKPNYAKFPRFEQDVQYIRDQGYQIAAWQSISWVDPEESGLSAEDLLCGPDGKPREWGCFGSPLSSSGYKYCIDPSSQNARQFLIDRTKHVMNLLQPAALKLDFGYGVPGPDISSPRNPELRGERYCAELLHIIATAAREVDPDVTIIYYGLHPLLHDHYDMINQDDLGDAGDSAEYELSGHNQRCMWAALAAGHGMALNTSTGYYWGAFESILLNTAVIGAGGLTLGEYDKDQMSISPRQINRWRAIDAWRRRTCGWKPLWLEADFGGKGSEPSIVSWGRLENVDGDERVTALALRNHTGTLKQYPQLESLRFDGEWAFISQDRQDVRETSLLACIPFRAGTITFDRSFNAVKIYRLADGQLECARTIKREERSSLQLEVTDEELSFIVGFIVES